MTRVLVTGCAGMIGSRVTELLLAAGTKVVGVDTMNDAYDVRLKDWRLGRLSEVEGFEFERIDIADEDAMDDLFNRYTPTDRPPPFTAVINLAARAGVRESISAPEVYFQANLNGTLSLLRLCGSHGIGKFVLSSTSSAYGNVATASSLGAHALASPLSEDMETSRPLSPYAASKKAAEVLAHTYHHLHGLDVTVLRYFTVYGPAGRPDMSLFRFAQKIVEGRPITVYGDGSQTRDFTYVDDVAEATILALRPLGYEVINVGSDSPVALREAISTIESLAGRPAEIEYRPMHPADVTATWADVSKAHRMLGWRPTTTFPDGIESLVRWYLDNRDWAREVFTDDPD